MGKARVVKAIRMLSNNNNKKCEELFMGEPNQKMLTHIPPSDKGEGIQIYLYYKMPKLQSFSKVKVSLFQNSLYLIRSHWPARNQTFTCKVQSHTQRESSNYKLYRNMILCLIMMVMKKQSG